MKDYNSFVRYESYEWEDDIQWKSERMSFLWDLRKFYIEIYLKNNLNIELQSDFYGINDREVSKIARKVNQGNYFEDCKRWNEFNISYLYEKYLELKRIKKNDAKMFLKRNNQFMYTYILERRYDELKDYIYNYEMEF